MDSEHAYAEFETKESRLLDHWLAPIVAHKAFTAGYAAGRLAQKEQDAKLVEDAQMPQEFHRTSVYTEAEQRIDETLKLLARAIREAGETKEAR